MSKLAESAVQLHQPVFRLLAVDDNSDNLYTLRTLIESQCAAGVELLEADSGAAALKMASEHSGIDLIILDVHMPDMDGFETARLLKARKRTRDIPIIFLTAAFKTEEFQQRGYALGAADYLLKPIDDNLLINKLSSYFRLIEKERQINRGLEAEVARRTQQLRESQTYLKNIIDTMGEALLVLDATGNIKWTNRAAAQMLCYPQEQLEKMAIGDIFEEETPEQARAFMGEWLQALIRSGVTEKIQSNLIRKDGGQVPILFSRRALKDNNNQVTDIICIAKDMTGYQRLDS